MNLGYCPVRAVVSLAIPTSRTKAFDQFTKAGLKTVFLGQVPISFSLRTENSHRIEMWAAQ